MHEFFPDRRAIFLRPPGEKNLLKARKCFFPTFTVVPERITSKPLRILIFLDYKKFLSLFFVYMQINPFITTKIWIFCLF